jgi:type IV secretory pathway component VirB8
MDDVVQKEVLYIPQGLKKKREYFDGYGWQEFKITLLATAITVGICIITFLISRNLVLTVFIFLSLPTTTVVFIVKNDSNISVVDQIHFMIRYAREQRVYEYRSMDELEYDYH